MATLTELQDAIVATLSAAIYPNGVGQASSAGVPCSIYAGWPVPQRLDADLAAGKANISVFPNGSEVDRTRYPPTPHVISVRQPTLTLSAAGREITVGGAMPAPFSAHNMAVKIGADVFVYAIQPGNTLSAIAAALASLIAVKYSTTVSSGVKITLPVGVRASVVVGTSGRVVTELSRQSVRLQVTVWASTPAARSAIEAVVKPTLAKATQLQLPDGIPAIVRLAGGTVTDDWQKSRLYRRDIFLDCEYATTETRDVPTVVAEKVTVQADRLGSVLKTFVY